VAAPFLTLRDITVRYGATVALQIAALELNSGEVLAIIGPNGGGKSTLLRVMGLLQRPSSGEVLFCGENPFEGKLLQLRRRIATVFQEPLLLNATVHENAALGLKLRGIAGHEIARRLDPWLERLGIAHLRGRSARSLSGGEAQRTSLARALALEPEILLLDEPFAALDPTSREILLRDFQAIVKDGRLTTVLVTHDRDEAFGLAGRVAVLHQGRLAQIGRRETVFRQPASEAVAEIVGVENRLRGVVEDCQDECAHTRMGQIRLKAVGRFDRGTRVVLCLRPEEVSLRREDCTADNLNRLTGTVTGVSSGVTHRRITLDCGGLQLVALMDERACAGLGLAQGEKVIAIFDYRAAHLIDLGANSQYEHEELVTSGQGTPSQIVF
jgi:tungstate transport system ATP-binding protein